MTTHKIIDDLEQLWAERAKDTKYQMWLGKYVIYYNPYDDKEVEEMNRLTRAYYDGFLKGGRDLAEKMLLKERSKENK